MSMVPHVIGWCAVAALLAAAPLACADEAADAPAPSEPAPAPAPIKGVVVLVEGKVRARASRDAAWQALKTGAELGEGSEIETALRAKVQIKVGAGQVLTIDRASRVALSEAVHSDSAASGAAGTDKTTLELPYGRVKFEVNSATVANDVRISAPDATLAVKGTSGFMEVAGGMPTLAFGGEQNTGTFEMTYRDRGVSAMVSNQQRSDARQPAPANFALGMTRLDVGSPPSRQGDERGVIQRAPGGGENQRLVTGRPPPPPPRSGGR